MPEAYISVETRIKIRKKKKVMTVGLWTLTPQKNESADSTFHGL